MLMAESGLQHAMVIPTVPTPTGVHPVGVVSLSLEEVSRPDPWVPEVPTRELGVGAYRTEHVRRDGGIRDCGHHLSGRPGAAFALGHGFVRTAEFWRKVKTGRARDVSFVLDELFGSKPPWAGAVALAPDRIGMAGHSAGGAATIAAMVADARIRAGCDVDGSTDPLIPDTGLGRSCSSAGTASTLPATDPLRTPGPGTGHS
ncbi:hypothetical protein ACFV2S_11580 [Streptomyces sp. NPDC059695]|uniref:hypothetical protein n=1 Tax=Streptomyces sp. NPDC059695 TaxID=3346910 RepID=UPI0036AC7002